MKIRTILGILLIIALVVSSTGVAAAETPVGWPEDYPPSWEDDDTSPCPVENVIDGDGPWWLSD